MNHMFPRLLRLLSGALLAAMLLSCETRQELQTRMDEISGEYRLTEMLVGISDWTKNIPENERNAATSARIYPAGKDWIFEYTLPIPNKTVIYTWDDEGVHFSYHKVRQRIIWDRALGAYFLYRLSDTDLPSVFDPDLVRMEIIGRGIRLTYKSTYTYYWTRTL